MGPLLTAALALAAGHGEVVIRVREPVAPTTVSIAFMASCGRQTLQIQNVGVARPLPGSPQLMLDGKKSGAAGSLITFLDRDDAVYRFFPECPRAGGFLVRVYRATPEPERNLRYEALAIRIDTLGTVRVSGPEEADAEIFWFW